MIKVKFFHEFFEIEVEGTKPQKVYLGTTCRLLDGETELAVGETKLSPNDHFSRPFGRSLALYRALEAYEHTQVELDAFNYLKEKNISILPRKEIFAVKNV